MKLVDKLILFTKFLKNNGGKFNMREEIKPRKDYWKKQAELWKDKSLHEEIDAIQAAIVMWSERYNDCLDRINTKTKELLREQELIVLRRDYDKFAASEPTLDIMLERASNYAPEFLIDISKDIGKGYRTLSNISDHGGQEVPHLHFHLFEGENIGRMVE